MKKRKVLLTGGSRGIGEAIKNELAGAGYEVVAPERAELDLADDKSLARFLEKNQGASFDILINVAGINNISPLEAIKDNDIDEMMAVNLVGPLKLARMASAGMKQKKWGRIVNISSIFGVVSKEKRTVYSATKFGINGITKALAVELGPYNILVNSVCPGYTETELTRKNVGEEDRKIILPNIPLRRFAQPDEIAKVVRFLVSEDNTYLTGQIIIADGGFTSC